MGMGHNCTKTPPIWPCQGEMACESMIRLQIPLGRRNYIPKLRDVADLDLSRLCTKSRSFIGFLGAKIGLSGLEKAFKMRLKRSY